LARAAVLQPGDLTTERLHEESTRFLATPPPPEWEAVLKLDSK
jgi:hypothetical protein